MSECTCKDQEFLTKPCEYCINKLEEEKRNFESIPAIVTDEHLVSDEKGVIQGFKLVCPYCGMPSIIVNLDLGDYCLNSACRKKVNVQSKTITEFIKRKFNK